MAIKDLFRRGKKQTALLWTKVSDFIPEWVSYTFTVPSFRSLSEEGYKQNGAVFACITALSLGFQEAPLRVWKQDEKGGRIQIPKHPLDVLLRKPNAQMSGEDLALWSMTYLAIGGNCYWYKLRSTTGRVVGLIPLSDAQIVPIGGKDLPVDHYEFYKADGSVESIPVKDIVQFRWAVDPIYPYKGLAPLMSVAREVDTDNEASRYLYTLLKNDAIPRLGLVIPPEVEVSDEMKQRIREEWQERYGGNNRGKPALLYGGMDVKRLSLDLGETACLPPFASIIPI